ncbi:MAG: ATPase, partial [Ruminiclostridium sp.]
MSIDETLEMMDEMLDKAVNVPLTNKKSLIDVEKMRELIEEIRLNMPKEIKQARDLVNDRKTILNDAKNEASA